MDAGVPLGKLDRDEAPSVADSVTERLEALIFDGLQPGDALPSEGRLADTLGVSRLTVREATRALEARGLLEIRQGRRPIVAPPSGALVGDFFKIAIRREPQALLELLDVRRALEVHIAALAAKRATRPAVADMEMAIAAMRTAQHPDEFHDADVRFHENLAAATGNRLLGHLIEAFAEPLRESRLRSFAGHVARGSTPEVTIDEHQAILDAVKARDSKAAATAMRHHLRETEKDLQAVLRPGRSGRGDDGRSRR